ncbi:unnamed protein product [Gordionus sp. m RMFG-2023]|uniref:venom phosphodiesterase-like n=1 Tax=Gordionus sp. m RMFG-2023 TaxID=3053472 RepID=UPI0030E14454
MFLYNLCLFSIIAIVSKASPPGLSPVCQKKGFTKAPLILINLDGFHPIYLKKAAAKDLAYIGSKGVMSEYMRPVYPTKTFPNLYTIVTGLYPESHGIVENHFKDPSSGTEFYHSKNETHNRIKWGGEPIWITAKKNGIDFAVKHWPGSQINFDGIGPSEFSRPGRTNYKNNIEQIFKWLKLPEGKRPGFMSLYFNEPDHSIHKFGPNSNEVDTAISKVGTSIRYLFNTLSKANLIECVNIIIVSDHGGTSSPCSGLVYLDKIADLGHVSFLAGPSVMIEKFKSKYTPEQLFEKVRCPKSQAKSYDVFKKKDFPRRHHYSNNDRIGDLVIKMKEGRNMFRYSNRPPPCEEFKGSHGYDDGLKTMQGLFMAYGAHFKKKSKILPFQSIELYNLMTALLGITPAPNNGTYGLLADALTIPHNPIPPNLQPVKYYGLRSGVKEGDGENNYKDEGYETDSDDYSKKIKRSIYYKKRATEDDDVGSKYPAEDDYYGTADTKLIDVEADKKAEKEREKKKPTEGLKDALGSEDDDSLSGVAGTMAPSGFKTAFKGDSKCCQASYGGNTRADSSPPSNIQSLKTNAAFEIPKSNLATVSILPENDYIIGYDQDNNYPLFASYLPKQKYNKQTSGKCISMDNRLSSDLQSSSCSLQSNLKDRSNSNLIPLKLYNGGDSSNIMSNVVYVYEDFYNNIWSGVMSAMTDVAIKRNAIVIVGPIFDHNGDSLRDNIASVPSYVDGKRILIPSHFFVMTLYCKDGSVGQCQARNVVINSFVIPHTKETENCETVELYIKKNYAKIKDIELLTGLNFFLKYPETDRIKLINHFYLNLEK